LIDPRIERDLGLIDAAAATLPVLSAPPELADLLLAEVERTPQEQAPPANRPYKRWIMAVGALAAAAVVVFVLFPPADRVGDPDNMVPRGIIEEVHHPVTLRMAVQTSAGGTERFQRGHSYSEGETLLFRADHSQEGWVHLVRVDERGVRLLHTQPFEAGTSDLMTSGLPLGYELEKGESAAVFALVAHSESLDAQALAPLGAHVDPVEVCKVARALGAQCAAERVEEVR
jgi:hypothetical protein